MSDKSIIMLTLLIFLLFIPTAFAENTNDQFLAEDTNTKIPTDINCPYEYMAIYTGDISGIDASCSPDI